MYPKKVHDLLLSQNLLYNEGLPENPSPIYERDNSFIQSYYPKNCGFQIKKDHVTNPENIYCIVTYDDEGVATFSTPKKSK